jgi:hypothetical protein
MVWIKEKGKKTACNKRTHYTQDGRKYVMERKHGGGTKRKYLH